MGAAVVQLLGVGQEDFSSVTYAHGRRNETTYRLPAPPVSNAQALEMLAVADRLVAFAELRIPDWFQD